MDFPDLNWLIAALAVFIAGIVRGFSGFGAGLILVPSLSLIYGPVTAVVSAMLLELVPALQLMPRALKHCHWRSVTPMVAAAMVTVPLGSMLLVVMEEQLIRVMIAVMVLLGTAILATGWRVSGKGDRRPVALVTGAVSGVLSGAIGLGGVPVVMFYLSSAHRAEVTRSSIIMFLLVTVLVSLMTFMFHGIVSEQIVLRCLSLAPLLLAATWLGGRIFGRVSEARFRSILLLLMSAVGVATLAV